MGRGVGHQPINRAGGPWQRKSGEDLHPYARGVLQGESDYTIQMRIGNDHVQDTPMHKYASFSSPSNHTHAHSHADKHVIIRTHFWAHLNMCACKCAPACVSVHLQVDICMHTATAPLQYSIQHCTFEG